MMTTFLRSLLVWLATLIVVIAAHMPGNNVALRTRNGPGMSDADTLYTVRRALDHVRLQSRNSKYSMNRTSISKSWVGATLFQYSEESSSNTTAGSDRLSSEYSAGIEIICTMCYINGSVTGDLTLAGDFNFTAAVNTVKSELRNVTDTAFHQFEQYVEEVAKDISKEIITLNATTLPDWPTLDVNLDLNNATGLPGAHIHFEFDNLELYLDLGIKLSAGATYTLNLYTSETPAGISVPGLKMGAVFSVDLILISDTEIDIGSGIHIKLDDGVAFDLEMFNRNVSRVTIPGGAYEFLPITIGGEGSIQALLSLKASLGVEVDTPKPTSDFDFEFNAGIETDVFAYVADFLMQVNGSSTTDSGDCELVAVAEYTYAVGAAAGATVAVDKSFSWGPSPNTTVPIWYTTLASICAATKTSTSAPASLITPRAELNQPGDSSLTTTTSTTTYQIVNCMSSGMINCPINLQNTTTYQAVVTSALSIESGSVVTLPTTGVSALATGIPFGSKSYKLQAVSGTPISYVPPPPSSTSATTSSTSISSPGGVGSGLLGVDKNNKLIIGLSVGLGVPFLAALLIGFGYYIRHRRKYSEVSQRENIAPSPEITESNSPASSRMKKGPFISVTQAD
ncbi:conserved hypothetical protein [Talaromyces stipitatus ATCC 10500]|uniref:Mid2 domain-containing protein n=1 Tax=Talaromyces stipitatus (strain ATCC 10500 / CBS 375.48 / QM 6759 / NRRL 1006) TaxID=441959 RepID=B8MRT8_TALSN|nr:uncharacterized protein TSTA_057620 [Talaromyces stipitatus ATCC 10500]EED13272.1 conserved hypothetical protein [Talaromyces stipitatus ATCC 10500]